MTTLLDELLELWRILPQARSHAAPAFAACDEAPSPEATLSAVEFARFESFASLKRRQEFLLGRTAARRAISRASGEARDLTITNAENGAPHVLERPGLLSITHGHGLAAAAWRPGQTQPRFGLDLERIQPRDPRGFRFFLREPERPALEGLATERRDASALAVWCLKEAAYKLLQPPRGHSIWDIEVCVGGPELLDGAVAALTLHGRLAAQAPQAAISGAVLRRGPWLLALAVEHPE